MNYRLFGPTGLRVSQLFLGAMVFGDRRGLGSRPGRVPPHPGRVRRGGRQRRRHRGQLRGGASEEIVGELLEEPTGLVRPGHQVHGDHATGRPQRRRQPPQEPRPSLETSLRRLRTDYVDVYWVHIWDPRTPDRGDDARPRRRGPRGQGALRRHLRRTRLGGVTCQHAGRAGAAGARSPASRCRTACSSARSSATCCRWPTPLRAAASPRGRRWPAACCPASTPGPSRATAARTAGCRNRPSTRPRRRPDGARTSPTIWASPRRRSPSLGRWPRSRRSTPSSAHATLDQLRTTSPPSTASCPPKPAPAGRGGGLHARIPDRLPAGHRFLRLRRGRPAGQRPTGPC